jgi:hypothetical protein
MAQKLDPKETVSFEELAYSNMMEQEEGNYYKKRIS